MRPCSRAMSEKKGGPEAANRLKKDMGQLFRFAAKRYGFAGQNPAALADTHKVRSQGFHTWTDDEVETFRAAHPIGSKARLALELFLGTGAACQDAAAMTRANIRGPRLSYRRGKTGQEVDLPILPELAKELAHLPRDQMMLLAHGTQGKGYTAGSLSNVFRDMCAEMGDRVPARGVRALRSTRLPAGRAGTFRLPRWAA